MTNREQKLYDWLHQACALLSVEARDHEENRHWAWTDYHQRKMIAKVLREFLVQATNVLDESAAAE